MKATLTALLALSCLGELVTSPGGPAENDCKAIFAKHWQVSKEFTLAVAEAMPAEDYGFKPQPEELSFGQLMVHIATQNSESCADATGTKPLPSMPPYDADSVPVMDKQNAIKLLTVSYDTCARALEAMPSEGWNKEVYKFQGQPVLANEALWYTFTNTAHHRGQAEVYLRLKKITPPKWRF